MIGRRMPPASSARPTGFLPLAGTVGIVALAFGVAGSAASASRASDFRAETGFVAVVALEGAGQVAVLNGPPWRVVSRANVPAGPHNVVASPDGETSP